MELDRYSISLCAPDTPYSNLLSLSPLLAGLGVDWSMHRQFINPRRTCAEGYSTCFACVCVCVLAPNVLINIVISVHTYLCHW